jgi:thiol-disulfide isomerase/thioredoxin
MRILVFIFILAAAATCFAQSGRTPGSDGASADPTFEKTAKDLFDEANGYNKTKFAEYEKKGIPYSDNLKEQTQMQQRKLAAKYAMVVGNRTSLAGDDLYYLGLLHWIAENYDGTAESMLRYTTEPNADAKRAQTARSLAAVSYAKLARFDDAEKALAEYKNADPETDSEIARMEVELAKAYLKAQRFAEAEKHALPAYDAAKAKITAPDSKNRNADELLDAGMILFETRKGQNEQAAADAALEDMRRVAALLRATTFYYYATDKQIVYQIETGRKEQALKNLEETFVRVAKEFSIPGQRDELIARFKKRETQYELIGESAIELPKMDVWFPGEERSVGSLKGKVILLDFWATWCGPCFDAFPHLIEWQDEFANDGLVILGITRYYGNIRGAKATKPQEIEFLKEFRTKEKLNYEILVSDGQEAQRLYSALSLPTAVIIDRKGVIRYVESGTSTSRIEEMRSMILKLLAEK